MNQSVCVPARDRKSFDVLVGEAEKVLKGEPGLVDKLKICLKEIFSNIREHAYHLDGSKVIYLNILITPREVVVRIMHAGPFWCKDGYVYYDNPKEQMLQLLNNGSERGRGHLMIFMCSDSFEYQERGRLAIIAWKRGDHG